MVVTVVNSMKETTIGSSDLNVGNSRMFCCFFFSSRRRHTRCADVTGVSDVCSSDLRSLSKGQYVVFHGRGYTSFDAENCFTTHSVDKYASDFVTHISGVAYIAF